MKRIFQCILLIGILYGCITISPNVKAEGEVGFNVQAVLPENQIDKNDSFFNLRMKPDQEQLIEVTINNTSDEDIVFEVNVNQAYTNNQGFIDYTDNSVEADSSLPFDINDLVKYENEVSVSAKSSKKVSFQLTMPSELYDGEILAGIKVNRKENKQEAKDTINNSVGYVLGLKLTETDKDIKRQVNLISVKPQSVFGKPTIVATIQNPMMASYGHLKYETEIIEKKSKKIFYKTTYDNDMQLAPNSVYPFAIEIKDKALVAGDYSLKLIVSDAKENKWTFNEDFTIKKIEADKINKATINKNDNPTIPWSLIVIGFVVLVLIIVSIIVLKTTNKSIN